MKKIIGMFVLLISTVSYGQVDANNNTLGALATYGPDGANVGGASLVINPPRPIEGSVYLFDEWRNNGTIQTADASYKLRNINFNAQRNAFESQIPNTDSIFTFDFTNIEKMIVNNRTFQNVYSPIDGGYKILEVIAEDGKYAIYKDNYIEIKEGSPNPMLAQANDKYIKRDSYYLKNGKSFKRFRMKKSGILKSMGNKAKKVENYAKENNLSFKNPQQLQKIVSYYGSL